VTGEGLAIIKHNRHFHPIMQNAATAAAPQAHIKDATTQSFAADVLEASKQQPVLVDFWAPWCGPCRQLTPVLEKVVNAASGKVKLVKMNIDEHPSIPGQLGVQSIPTVIAFKDGKPVDAFMGALPESQLKQFVEALGSGANSNLPDMEQILKAGEAALARADTITALETFAAILDHDPHNPRALSGMAQAYLLANEIDKAKAILAQVPKEKENDPAIVRAKSAIELAEKAGDVGELDELILRVRENPKDLQARFDLGLAYAGRGQRREAADELIEILRQKRDWNDDGAKKQLLQFFEAWGFDDDASVYGRKKLSSLLFA
jgi:putative thioredoxin